jgi:alpha-1,2-mannosyltransferase
LLHLLQVMARLIISAALVILALAVSTLVLSPLLLRYIGQAVGRLLRKRTQARRSHILSRVAVEEREYASKLKSDAAAEEDWETVEGYAAGTAKNGEKADQDWEGVVGFFHPFW